MRESKQDRAVGRSWRRLAFGLGWASVAAGAFVWGRYAAVPKAAAQTPAQSVEKPAESPVLPPIVTGPASDFSRRIVAYINGNQPITREDLGEYLIARYGAEKLELLINKRIIEQACQAKGIEVTEAEIDAALADDLKSLTVNRDEFVKQVLKRYNKTLYEWRQDKIRPQLYLTKLSRDRVKVEPEDLHNAYDAYFGPKVQCQVIFWMQDQEHIALKCYEDLRKSDADFDRCARQQANPTLAAKAGLMDPFGHHTFGDDKVEQVAFSLREGEVSQLLQTQNNQGFVVLKCIKQIPANQTKTFDEVRQQLEKEVFDKKVQQTIPIVFQELKQKADPKSFLQLANSDQEIRQAAELEMQYWLGKPANPAAKPPMGN
jgi:parvulin-like peptidyl-prolyl isomerase